MNRRTLLKAVRPLQNRIHLDNTLRCLAAAVFVAALLGFLLACYGFAFPVPFLLQKVLVTYAAFFTLGILFSLFLRPGKLLSIRRADALGLKERIITAWELWGDDSPVAVLQREDTLEALAKTDFKKLYRLRLPVYFTIAALLLSIFTAVSFFIPTQAREEAKHVEELMKVAKKQAEAVEKVRKELQKEELYPGELSELDRLLKQLQREMKAASTEEEVLKALSRAENEMKELKQLEALRPDMEKLAESLSRHELTRSLAEALKNKDPEQIKNLLEQLNDNLKKMDKDERKALAESIENAAREIAENKELAQSLADFAEAVRSGDLKSASGALQDMSSTLSEMSGKDSQLAEAMSKYRKELLSQLSSSLGEVEQKIASYNGSDEIFGGDESEEGEGGQGHGQEGNEGQGTGQGNGEGGGQGSSPGQSGQGNGSGTNGSSGAGNGSSNGNLGYSEEQAGASGRQPGQKTVKDYESIYVPERLGDDPDANSSQIKGGKGDSGQSSWSEAEGAPVQKGTALPYNEVLGDYKSDAMSSLGDNPVPPVMKEMVRDYFTSLE